MRAGKLRTSIDIERYTISRGTSGSEVKTWTTLLSGVAADFEVVGGSERYAAQQLLGVYDAVATIRYHRLIDETCRVKCGGKYYDVASAIDVGERHREIKLMLKTFIDV